MDIYKNIIPFIALMTIGLSCSAWMYYKNVNHYKTSQPKSLYEISWQSDTVRNIDFGGNVGLEDGLTVYLDEPDPAFTIKTCHDYFGAVKKGWEPFNTYEITMESFMINQCQAQQFYDDALDPEFSKFDDLSFVALSVSLLPGQIGGLYQINNDPVCRNADTLQNCILSLGPDNNFHQITLSDNTMTIDRPTNDVLSLSLAGSGDYNHDGWNDLLINYAYHVYGGSYRKYGNLCLEWTRTMPKPRLLNCMHDDHFE